MLASSRRRSRIASCARAARASPRSARGGRTARWPSGRRARRSEIPSPWMFGLGSPSCGLLVQRLELQLVGRLRRCEAAREDGLVEAAPLVRDGDRLPRLQQRLRLERRGDRAQAAAAPVVGLDDRAVLVAVVLVQESVLEIQLEVAAALVAERLP